MKTLIKLIIFIVIPLTLFACEGGGTVQSGVGHADDNGNAATPLPSDGDVSVNGAVNSTSVSGGQCAEAGITYIEPLIGCSQESYLTCQCYDPTNPNQPKL